MPKAYQKLNTLGVKIRFMRWNTRNPRSGVICLHQWKFSSASDSVRFPWNAFPRFSQDLRAKTILSTAQKAVELPPRSVPITKILSKAVDSGIILPARLGVTTSMICDGNINTFRYVSRHTDLDTYVIDVPDSCSPEAVEYVTMQLKELIQKLEALTGKRLSMDDLSETLARENQSKAYYKEFLKLQAERYYPSTLTLQMYMLLPPT